MVNMALSRKKICKCQILLLCLSLTVLTLIISGTQLNLSDNRFIIEFNTSRKKTTATLENINSGKRSRRIQKSPVINMTLNRWPVTNKTRVTNPRNISLDNEVLTNQTEINHKHNQTSAVKNTGKYATVISDETYKKRANRMGTPNATLSPKKDLKIVIILAYMHTGSTYTAQMIKNHPGTFYEFEPLRTLQKSSRRKRRIVYLNGTSRQVSGEDVDTDVGAEAVGNMVTCNHQQLDIASLSTYYPGSSDTNTYFDCLVSEDRFGISGHLNFQRLAREDRNTNFSHTSKANLTIENFKQSPSQFNYHKDFRQGKNIFSREEGYLSRNTRVRKHLSKHLTRDVLIKRAAHLPNRFLSLNSRGTTYRPVTLYDLDSRSATDSRDRFHDLIFSTMKENIEKCLPLLTYKCREANLRLTKFIRMTMKMAGKLLENNRDVRVIHLLRDPRAMMDSQLRKNDMNVKLFQLFKKRTYYMCSRMQKDLSLSVQLKAQYPDRIFTLRYEDLVDDPLKTGQRVFDFIDIPFTSNDKQFIVSTSLDTERNATYRANIWRDHISQRHLNVVNTYCKDLYKELGYVYFNSVDSVRNLHLQDHLKK